VKLVYHRAAENEVIAAAAFYEGKTKGLGLDFLDEFDRSVTRIMESPGRWRIVEGDKRRFLMPRFPYGIYYRIADGEVRVLVIKHHSQHPEYGMGRV
jgi:plasmid stabilization system protein ParE